MKLQKELPSHHLMYSPYTPAIPENEIDIRKIFKILWKGKWIIVIITFLFVFGAAFYAFSLPNLYKADALLAPTDSSGSGSLSRMAEQMRGVIALTGMNLGRDESSQADLAVEVMKSRQFIENFVKHHDLLVPLLATKKWDLSSNTLILNDEIYDKDKKEWLRMPQGLRGKEPSAQEAYEFFSSIFSVARSKESNLYTVSIKHYSPYIAKQWVNWLIEDINKVMRERTIAEASQNLAYLNAQLQKTPVAEMQTTFYRLIEEQTKSLMLAEVQEQFVFKIIDPAVVPETKDSPKRQLLIILGVLIGVFFGLFITVVINVFRNDGASSYDLA